ncbi:MAG TPA: MFS transporter [Steroidobacteraceae bacterium]|nr:MFS transporter [Steroidobacteraceae bacterium]
MTQSRIIHTGVASLRDLIQRAIRPAGRRGAGLRWVILLLIFLLSFSAFIERTTLAVAAERMMPELALTQVQLGWLLTAFVVGYTAFQFPGGVVGLRYGAHRVLFLSALLGAIASVLLVVIPWLAAGTMMVSLLCGSRFLLGVAQAPLYPVSSGALVVWFPARQWALALGLLVTGIGLGAAVTPPAVAWLMSTAGWRASVVLAAIPGALAGLLWWLFGRDDPNAASGAATLSSTDHMRQPTLALVWREALGLVVDPDVLALSVSYVLDNAVVYLMTYWSFLYLVQERHFTVLEGGALASVPFLIGAIGAAIGGRSCDVLCQRVGVKWGVRLIPLLALPVVAVSLCLAARSADASVAVLALTVCYGGLQMVEGSYWGAGMRLGGERTMAATGVLNTGGNLGGVVITPIIGYLSAQRYWTACFVMGAACALAAALLWLFVDATRARAPEARLSELNPYGCLDN